MSPVGRPVWAVVLSESKHGNVEHQKKGKRDKGNNISGPVYKQRTTFCEERGVRIPCRLSAVGCR